METNNNLSQLHPLYDKKVNCPFCEGHFTTKKVRSRFIKPQKVDSDFGPMFKESDYNPLYYYVMICPHCGFSFTEDYKNYFRQTVRDIVKKEITDKKDKNLDYCGERDYERAVGSYKLGIYCAQLVQENHIVFAHLCLRLAWIFRGKGKSEEELRFLKLALAEYEKSYFNSDFDPEKIPEMHILYLLGELNRRLENYSDAIKYFSSVAEHEDKSKYKKYVNLSSQQRSLAIDQYRMKNSSK